MSVEYRPACAEELRDFAYGSRVGFGNTTADADIDRSMADSHMKPEWTLCAFDDGRPVTQMATLPLTMRWNGRDIACGGVTAVSTLPTHRRRGHLRALMTRAFGDMRAAGRPVAMLWASMAAIYQRFGYGIACEAWVAEFDPRHVRFVDGLDVRGHIRIVKFTDALPVVGAAYDRFAASRTLALQRDEDWWVRNVLRSWRPDAPPFLVAVYEEADEVLGYIIYGVEQDRAVRPGPDLIVGAGELVWQTAAAHRALMRYLAGYDLAHTIRLWRLPADDPLFHHMQEPRLLDFRVRDGTLVRIVDLVPALEGRGYETDGRLTFAFADDLCPWNAGTWELTVEGGVARVKPAAEEPGLCLSSRVLAMMATGYQQASTLARIGLIPPADPRTLAVADALFRTSHAPICMDGF